VLLGEVEVTGEELDELIVVVRHHGLLLLLLLLLLRSWRFLGGFGDEVRGGCALTAISATAINEMRNGRKL
jgi:hypothetical protein